MVSFRKTAQYIREILNQIHERNALKDWVIVKCDENIRDDLYYLIFPERMNYFKLDFDNTVESIKENIGEIILDDTITFHTASRLIVDLGLIQVSKYDDMHDSLSLTCKGYRFLLSDNAENALRQLLEECK